MWRAVPWDHCAAPNGHVKGCDFTASTHSWVGNRSRDGTVLAQLSFNVTWQVAKGAHAAGSEYGNAHYKRERSLLIYQLLQITASFAHSPQELLLKMRNPPAPSLKPETPKSSTLNPEALNPKSENAKLWCLAARAGRSSRPGRGRRRK